MRSKENNERRSNNRLAVELIANIYCSSYGESKTFSATIRELNELGLSFRLPSAAELPEFLRIEIDLGEDKLKIPAKVAWRAEQNTVYGVTFENVSESIISSLASLLERLSSSSMSADKRVVDRRNKERRSDIAELWRELDTHRTFMGQLRSKFKSRVAVTGLGIICPLGDDLNTVWVRLASGRSGIAKPVALDFEPPWPGFVVGQTQSFDPVKYLGLKRSRRMNRHAQLGCAAAMLAMEDARLLLSASESLRAGLFLGTSIGGMEDILTQHKKFLNRGIEKVQPFAWLAGSVGDSAAEISLSLKLRGPSHTICTGSASSADALGYAFRAIQSGDLQVAIVGGAEAPIFLEMLSLFHRTGVMAVDAESPLDAMKPFDKRRTGFVVGEGAAFLVLENMDRAVKRKAAIRGEISGYGNSCDAHHPYASDPIGRGMASAIRAALECAGLEPQNLDYVNLHGTGTLVGDRSETRAMKRVFASDCEKVSFSATKPYTGHLLGATGAIEVVFTLLAMQKGVIPPTLNLKQPDPNCDLDYTPVHSKRREVRAALSVNSGFGGKNAALVIQNVDHRSNGMN